MQYTFKRVEYLFFGRVLSVLIGDFFLCVNKTSWSRCITSSGSVLLIPRIGWLVGAMCMFISTSGSQARQWSVGILKGIPAGSK